MFSFFVLISQSQNINTLKNVHEKIYANWLDE